MPRRAETIGSRGNMIKLVLNQHTALQVTAGHCIVNNNKHHRDNERQYTPEPFMHLLLHACFLPASGAAYYLLSLSQNIAPFLRERFRRPQKQMLASIRVVDASGITDDLSSYPFLHFVGVEQLGAWVPVFGGDEVNWWEWPALVIVRRYLFTGSDFTFLLIPRLTMNTTTSCNQARIASSYRTA